METATTSRAPESSALLLRRQAGYNETFRAKMSSKPNRLGYESGVTMWWNQSSFASIGIGFVEPSDGGEALPTGRNGEPTVTYLLLESGVAFSAGDAVQLAIDATPTDYTLTLSAGRGQRERVLRRRGADDQPAGGMCLLWRHVRRLRFREE